MFTCRDGKGGKLSSQTSKMLHKPPGAGYIKQLLDEVEHDIMNYQNLVSLLTQTRGFDNS